MRRYPDVPVESRQYRVVKVKTIREEMKAVSFEEAVELLKTVPSDWTAHIVEIGYGTTPDGKQVSEETILW